jgi:hypothetical protein
MDLNEIPHNSEIVELKIKNINQLFNSFDPSPFIEKDLDDDAVQYIFSSFSEHHLKTKIKIMIHLPESKRGKFNEEHIRDSIRNFFVYKDMIANNEVDLKIDEGKKSLLIGLTFLVFCLSAKHSIELFLPENIFTIISSEALMIFGWVSMWKPISNMLYDWWPLRKSERIYDKISRSEIDVIYY